MSKLLYQLIKASQAEAEAGVQNTHYMTPLRTAQAIAALGGGGSGSLVRGSPVATTTGTSIDITGLPVGISELYIMLNGVSASGTSIMMLQLGDAGGIETTGYASEGSSSGSVTGGVTNGLAIDGVAAAAYVRSGIITLYRYSTTGHQWIYNCMHTDMSAGSAIQLGAGQKTLTAELDRIRLTTVAGLDTFDAGDITIAYRLLP